MHIEPTHGVFDTAGLISYLRGLPYVSPDPLEHPSLAGRSFLIATNGRLLRLARERRGSGELTTAADLVIVAPTRIFVGAGDPTPSTRHFITWLSSQYTIRATDDEGLHAIPLPRWEGTPPPIIPAADDGLWDQRIAAHNAWLKHRGQGARLELADADLREINLAGRSLRHSRWERVVLVSANFEEADLSSAELIDVDLTEATLERAVLRGASIIKSRLDDVFLAGADLTRSRWEQTSLVDAELDGADLTEVDWGGSEPSSGC